MKSAFLATPTLRRLLWLLGIAFAAVLPFLVSSYHLFQATNILIYSIALLGLNLLIGYNGQLSLGHGAFFGAGAYAAIILVNHAGLPHWVTVPLVGLLCLSLGFLFGLPALRLDGHYLALATFALALALPQILKHPGLSKWTGGFMGVTVPPIPVPSLLPLKADQWLYFLCLLYTVGLFLAVRNIVNGRTGRAIIALRDNPTAARSMGVNAAFYKSATFGVSAMYAGIAGAFSAFATQFASPDSFDLFLSITFVVGIVIGGVATISGAAFGAFFIQFVPDLASEISKAATWAVYGTAIIVFVYLLPQGIAGALDALFKRRSREEQLPEHVS